MIFFAPTDNALDLALGDLSQHAEWLVPWQGMQDFDFSAAMRRARPAAHSQTVFSLCSSWTLSI